MRYTDIDLEGPNIRDNVYAVVKDNCATGLFLELETGEDAFARFSFCRPGAQVLCTVLKKAEGSLRTLVAVDSVLCGGLSAA